MKSSNSARSYVVTKHRSNTALRGNSSINRHLNVHRHTSAESIITRLCKQARMLLFTGRCILQAVCTWHKYFCLRQVLRVNTRCRLPFYAILVLLSFLLFTSLQQRHCYPRVEEENGGAQFFKRGKHHFGMSGLCKAVSNSVRHLYYDLSSPPYTGWFTLPLVTWFSLVPPIL